MSSLIEQIDLACQHLAASRLLARQLADFAAPFGLKETEFRLLWKLRNPDRQVDQTELVSLLGCSPAQVSALVENLKSQGLIYSLTPPEDRRRCVWHVTSRGQEVLQRILRSGSELGLPGQFVSTEQGRAAA